MARSAGLFAVAMLVTTTSIAAPAKKKLPDLEPALPSPSLTLKVTPAGAGNLWRLTIDNTGDGPVRIAADPRLLVLELVPAQATPKSKAVPRCILPDDARPSTDDGSELVVPPKRSWSASFDPLFYCFGAKERAALTAGTVVKASFGWPRGDVSRGTTSRGSARSQPTKTAPYAATPVGASIGKASPAKVLEAAPFTLTDAVIKPPDASASEASVRLTVPEAMDAARGSELGTTVTLVNGSDRSITLLYRASMLQWNVSGPNGSVACGTARSSPSPIRELFSTIPTKGKIDMSVLFTTSCPAGTFDEPGIYRLTPKLDTTNVSGMSVGLKTWEAVAVATTPMLLRVRSPRRPPDEHGEKLARPALD